MHHLLLPLFKVTPAWAVENQGASSSSSSPTLLSATPTPPPPPPQSEQEERAAAARHLEIQMQLDLQVLLELKLQLQLMNKDGSSSRSVSSASISSTDSDPGAAGASLRTTVGDDGNSGPEASAVLATTDDVPLRPLPDPSFRRDPNFFKELSQLIKAKRIAASVSTTLPKPASAKHPETPLCCAENKSSTKSGPTKDGCCTGRKTGPQHDNGQNRLHGLTRACAESDSADDSDSAQSSSECSSPRVPHASESKQPVSISDAPRSIPWSVEDVDPSLQYLSQDIYGDKLKERIARKFRQVGLRQWQSSPELYPSDQI